MDGGGELGRLLRGPELLQIHEVGDHVDAAGGLVLEVRPRPRREVLGDRGHRVRGADRVLGQGRVARVVPHERDVRPVQRGHDLERSQPRAASGLSHEERADRVGQRVVGVEHVEALAAMQVEDPRHDREVVGRGVEQGVGAALGHVQLDSTRTPRESRGHLVAEEVNRVPVLREGQRQLAGDHARAAVGGMTEDSDAHRGRAARSRDQPRGSEVNPRRPGSSACSSPRSAWATATGVRRRVGSAAGSGAVSSAALAS